MNRRSKYLGHMLAVLVSCAALCGAGDLEPPASPDDPASAMPTLEDLFLRLTQGADYTLREYFVEPTGAPGGTGHSLPEIMAEMPSSDNVNGASPEEVLAGRTFWGLRTDGPGWGMLTGTMDAQSIDPETTLQPAGIYTSFDLAAEDPDLAQENVRAGVTVYGIVGTSVEAAGSAEPTDVLEGQTFSNDQGPATGTMVDNGAVEIIPAAEDQPIPAGFHDGGGVVQGDSDLEPTNIRSGVEVFGVEGELEEGCSCAGNLNGTRWCDNLDGTVTDLTTCLIWLRRADWGQIHPWVEGEITLGAHSRASSLKEGDLGSYLSDGSQAGDWRLPTKKEVEWLVSGPEGVSFEEQRAFVGITETNYWTSATSLDFPSLAWTISPDVGIPALAPKVSPYSVWPVRSGP